MTNAKMSRTRALTVAHPDIYFDVELRELSAHGVLVKRLDCRATSQIAILTAFQEENWPRRIDDPLYPNYAADAKSRLRSTIHSLNGGQRPPLIHFFADGSGHGIRWELVRNRRGAGPSSIRQHHGRP